MLGGAFTACAAPCELDRDCAGRCASVPDSLELHCGPGPECGDDRDCPYGFTCLGGSCAPAFSLGERTRVVCQCDDDCAPGLDCVTPEAPGAPRRCEARCRTGSGPASAWCDGAYACGAREDDGAGLAEVDAVCGLL